MFDFVTAACTVYVDPGSQSPVPECRMYSKAQKKTDWWNNNTAEAARNRILKEERGNTL